MCYKIAWKEKVGQRWCVTEVASDKDHIAMCKRWCATKFCVTNMVCDKNVRNKVVCDRVLCKRCHVWWMVCVAKKRVTDDLWHSCVWQTCVCKMVCGKGCGWHSLCLPMLCVCLKHAVWHRWCVTEFHVMGRDGALCERWPVKLACDKAVWKRCGKVCVTDDVCLTDAVWQKQCVTGFSCDKTMCDGWFVFQVASDKAVCERW